jgi:hypothetical protein
MLRPKKEDLAGESLIYEKASGITYAKFRDEPKKSLYPGRWEIGRDVSADPLLDYAQWRHLIDLSKEYPTLKKQLEQLLTTYYVVKEKQ